MLAPSLGLAELDLPSPLAFVGNPAPPFLMRVTLNLARVGVVPVRGSSPRPIAHPQALVTAVVGQRSEGARSPVMLAQTMLSYTPRNDTSQMQLT